MTGGIGRPTTTTNRAHGLSRGRVVLALSPLAALAAACG